jgi:biotin operon repressor
MYLSKSEAAAVLGVSYRYITKLIVNGTLKVELNVLGKERILQKDVLELKKVREVHIDFDRTKYISSAELADRLGVSRASVSVTYKQKISHIVVGRIDFDRTKYISSAELADRLGVSRASVSVTYKQKISHIVVGREVLFAASAVDQYIEDSKLGEEQTRGYLTVVRAARIIGTSPATVYSWCNSGGLAYSIGERNKKMIHPDEVERARKEYAGVAANILRNKV